MRRRRVLSLVADGPALITALSFHPIPEPVVAPVVVKGRRSGYTIDFETYSSRDLLYPYQRAALEAMEACEKYPQHLYFSPGMGKF